VTCIQTGSSNTGVIEISALACRLSENALLRFGHPPAAHPAEKTAMFEFGGKPLVRRHGNASVPSQYRENFSPLDYAGHIDMSVEIVSDPFLELLRFNARIGLIHNRFELIKQRGFDGIKGWELGTSFHG
jgi:hypothetical protein